MGRQDKNRPKSRDLHPILQQQKAIRAYYIKVYFAVVDELMDTASFAMVAVIFSFVMKN